MPRSMNRCLGVRSSSTASAMLMAGPPSFASLDHDSNYILVVDWRRANGAPPKPSLEANGREPVHFLFVHLLLVATGAEQRFAVAAVEDRIIDPGLCAPWAALEGSQAVGQQVQHN